MHLSLERSAAYSSLQRVFYLCFIIVRTESFVKMANAGFPAR
ncbi:hypothetical protein EVA_18966 [gut metagenome]|uniref:Uncharacterized protein n=1 Tax=gut metagenome TaxID=749906 RepID=J9FET0_9ZZZZ